MKIDRSTIDYKISMDNLRWMEDIVPMTRSERLSLRSWVMQGNDIDSNPWELRDLDGMQLNYLEAFRLENGYVNANVHTEHTAPYKNIVEVDVPLKNGGNMKLTDYASAGKLWNDESKMAVWMLTC